MNENEIVTSVLDEAMILHKSLGPGLLESVYETVLAYEIRQKGFDAKQQVIMPFKYKNIQLQKSFVADIIINDLVILEIKSQKENQQIHRMQLLSYLKVSKKSLGLVLNFGMRLMREGISRVVNDL